MFATAVTNCYQSLWIEYTKNQVRDWEATGLLLATKLIQKGNPRSLSHHLHWQSRPHNRHHDDPWTLPPRRLPQRFGGYQEEISPRIKWVPAHEGVEGNEKADRTAKKAVTHNSSRLSKLSKFLTTSLPHSRSATKQAYRTKIKEETQAEWTSSPRFNRTKHINSKALSAEHIELISPPLPRKSASIIT